MTQHPMMLCTSFFAMHSCSVMLSSRAVTQLFAGMHKHEIPLRAGSALIALSACVHRTLVLFCLPAGVMFPAGHPRGCSEPVSSGANRLFSSVLYRARLRALTRSCVLLLLPSGMIFSLFSVWSV